MRSIVVVLLFTCAAPVIGQTVVNPALKVQRWVRGLDQPTGFAFVDDAGTGLALEKSTGRVRIVQGKTITGTALDLPVSSESERGLLGIALSPHFRTDNFVYLYYTRTSADGAAAIENRVDRFLWNGSTLSFSRRVLSLPVDPGPNHNGGKLAFGPDGKLYVGIGELNRNERTSNFENSTAINRVGAILRANPSGTSVVTNPFYSPANVGTAKAALNDIYAYGVRNTFGMAFDPKSGDLWDTENGPDRMDEINRVRPEFNSGWEDVMGPTARDGGSTGKLVSLGERAYYSDPRFSWATPIAPTDALFFPSARLGKNYKNDLFVGTLHGGAILHFDLSETRKSLILDGDLADGVADNSSTNLFAEQQSILFASGFGTISDLVPGPGGMFVLSLTNGSMYRITTAIAPASVASMLPASLGAVPEPSTLAIAVLMSLVLVRRRRGRR